MIEMWDCMKKVWKYVYKELWQWIIRLQQICTQYKCSQPLQMLKYIVSVP